MENARTALVTGANRGIGYEIANGLAAMGIRVLVASRTIEVAQKAVDELGYDNVFPVALDLSQQQNIKAQVEAILSVYGQVDILVNNAGIAVFEGLLDVAMQDVERCFQVNTFAPLELMKLLVPSMQKNNFGRIVNLSSVWGSFGDGMQGPIAYAASKAALNALTVSAAHQMSGNIKINAMCPGWVHTQMGGPDAPKTPKEGADTAIWLATLGDDGPSGGFFTERQPLSW